MNQTEKNTYQKITASQRLFKHLSLSLVILGFILTILVIVLNMTNTLSAFVESLYAFLFFSFFFSILCFFITIILYAKNNQKVRALVIETYWQPWLGEVTRYYDNYEIKSSSHMDRIITHPIIPSDAEQHDAYELILDSIQRKLIALSYTKTNYNGQHTQQTTFFKGYVIFTDVEVEKGFFLRREQTGVLSKLSSMMASYKPKETKDGYQYEGHAKLEHKAWIEAIEKLGYKDVFLFEQDRHLVVCVEDFKHFPRLYTKIEKMKVHHMAHLRKLVDLIQVLS